jgi:threonine dehydrogenase-like Zn-dependent dehydrogenase
MARYWCGSVPEESADPTCTIIMKAESWISKFASLWCLDMKWSRLAPAWGRIVQVGIHPAGQSAVLVNKLVAKELELIGTFLSNEEFRWAVDALVHGRIDIGPILTGEFSLADAISAFEMASDRSKAMKVSLVTSV